ncbi:MAG: IS200/IS605 family transposase [Terriglobia bacterium]
MDARVSPAAFYRIVPGDGTLSSVCPHRDHVHMMILIPPKYVVSQVIGYMKGKSAIHLARAYGGRKQNFVGQHYWARGYYVSVVGRDEEAVRKYIREQQEEGKRLDQMGLWK